jgi:hypothetical protein
VLVASAAVGFWLVGSDESTLGTVASALVIGGLLGLPGILALQCRFRGRREALGRGETLGLMSAGPLMILLPASFLGRTFPYSNFVATVAIMLVIAEALYQVVIGTIAFVYLIWALKRQWRYGRIRWTEGLGPCASVASGAWHILICSGLGQL